MSLNFTEGQIEAFAKALVKAGIIDNSQITENNDLIEQALKLSLSREGLAQVLYNHTQVTGSELIKTQATNANTGQVLTRPIHDPIEIFTALYISRKNTLEDERKKHQALVDKAETDWYYFEHNAPASKKYDVSLGGFITKEYFMQNLYPCSHPSCRRRFPTEDEAKKHAYRHYATVR
jgi:hypothetical protein